MPRLCHGGNDRDRHVRGIRRCTGAKDPVLCFHGKGVSVLCLGHRRVFSSYIYLVVKETEIGPSSSCIRRYTTHPGDYVLAFLESPFRLTSANTTTRKIRGKHVRESGQTTRHTDVGARSIECNRRGDRAGKEGKMFCLSAIVALY